MITLPRELAELEPRVHDGQCRGHARTAEWWSHIGSGVNAADRTRSPARANLFRIEELQKELKRAARRISRRRCAPGVLRATEGQLAADDSGRTLVGAHGGVAGPGECGRRRQHLAKDLIQRLKTLRASIRKIRASTAVKRFAAITRSHSESGHRSPHEDDWLLKRSSFSRTRRHH